MQKKISTSLVASFLLATTNLYSVQNLETITVNSALIKSDEKMQHLQQKFIQNKILKILNQKMFMIFYLHKLLLMLLQVMEILFLKK